MIKVKMNTSGLRQLEREIAQAATKKANEALLPLRRVAATMKGRPADEVRAAVVRAAATGGIRFDAAELDGIVDTISSGEDQEFTVRLR